jgi:hypothetical protein
VPTGGTHFRLLIRRASILRLQNDCALNEGNYLQDCVEILVFGMYRLECSEAMAHLTAAGCAASLAIPGLVLVQSWGTSLDLCYPTHVSTPQTTQRVPACLWGPRMSRKNCAVDGAPRVVRIHAEKSRSFDFAQDENYIINN